MSDYRPKGDACRECGMWVDAGEYHPYAACLMYHGCGDAVTVRANLRAVIDHGRDPRPSEEDA